MASEAKRSRFSATTTLFALIAALAFFWVGRVTWDYFDPNSPANLAMQVQLKMFGSAMYEYHSRGELAIRERRSHHSNRDSHPFLNAGG